MLKATYRRVRMAVAIVAIAIATFLVSAVTIDLGPSLKASAAWGANGLSKLPWDVFALKGCQE